MEKENKRLKVLAVDDNKAILMINKEHLSARFDVITKMNDKEAMLWMEAGNFPDIIVADMEMNNDKEAGFKFLKNIRSSGYFSAIPIIILSGSEEAKDTPLRVKCLNEGANAFMTKPFSPEELEANITAILRTAGKL